MIKDVLPQTGRAPATGAGVGRQRHGRRQIGAPTWLRRNRTGGRIGILHGAGKLRAAAGTGTHDFSVSELPGNYNQMAL
jgi:hypothetical protein